MLMILPFPSLVSVRQANSELVPSSVNNLNSLQYHTFVPPPPRLVPAWFSSRLSPGPLSLLLEKDYVLALWKEERHVDICLSGSCVNATDSRCHSNHKPHNTPVGWFEALLRLTDYYIHSYVPSCSHICSPSVCRAVSVAAAHAHSII